MKIYRAETRLVKTRIEIEDDARFDSPSYASRVAHRLIGAMPNENILGMYLNGHNKLIAYEIVGIGTPSSALVHPVVLFGPAVRLNCTRMIWAHNHPSGDPSPSAEDGAVFDRIRRASDTLGIVILDALIVTPDGDYYASSTGYAGALQ